MVSWISVGQVLLYAIVAGALLVSAFSFGLVNLDRYEASRQGSDVATQSEVRVGALIMAGICFAVCVVGVALGLMAMLIK